MSLIIAGEKSKIVCPKCKSNNYQVEEIVEEVMIVTVTNGVFPECADSRMPGLVSKVSCLCSNCHHDWKPRKIKQITQMVD